LCEEEHKLEIKKKICFSISKIIHTFANPLWEEYV